MTRPKIIIGICRLIGTIGLLCHNWSTSTQYIIPVLYDKVIVIATNFEWTSDRLSTSDFRLSTSNFAFWALDSGLRFQTYATDKLRTLVSDSDFLHTFDFRLWFLDFRSWTDIRSTSDFGHNSDSFWTDVGHQTSDFVRLRTSDCRLWTLDISFQTSDCGLRTYFRRRIVGLIVRHRTDVKLRTQRLGQFICHTTKTNIHM